MTNTKGKVVVFDYKEVILLEEIDDNTTKVLFRNGYVQILKNSIKEVYEEMKRKLQ